MKILLFTDNLGAGGAQRQLVGLAVMLKQQNYDVKVCTYYPHDFYKTYLDENNVKKEIILGADNAKRRIFVVRSYFKKEHPDWVIAYQETPSLVACAAKALGCNYKLLVSERNTTQTVGMNERVRFQLYRLANVIVPNSYSQEQYLIEHYSWMKRKITTITNFVDLEKFYAVDHIRRDIPEIVVAASLMQSKNALRFIEACSLLKQRNIKFHVSWYGFSPEWPDYYQQCLDLIMKYELEDNVCIQEKTQQIADKYRECDYFCLPSLFEGTPNVICEAISTGIPVMCSNICDNPHYVHAGENGILFDPLSPEDIAGKMNQLLSQSESEYQEFRKASRMIAEEKLSGNLFITKYLSILQ